MNKKTYILGVLAIALLAGIVWYASQNPNQLDNQSSSASDAINQNESDDSKTIEELSDDLFLGSPDAKVVIIEYSSHFCGHCINFHKDTLPLIMDKYIKTGQVKLISRFLSPIDIGIAILCAEEEGRFSEYSEEIFENPQNIRSINDLKTIASDLELNDSFNQCLDSGKYKDRAGKWFDQATESEVEGTPTFFINGNKIVGNQPYYIFEEMIEQALAQ